MMKTLITFFCITISLNAFPDLEKGKRLYNANCLQCHNKNPGLKGSLEPELIDTPLEVMTIKVTTGRYPVKFPVGYVPKRKTKVMRAFPLLKDDINSIRTYIQSFKRAGS